MKKPLSIGVDIGGTHITCAALHLAEGKLLPGTLVRETYDHHDAADLILRRWAAALNETLLTLDESQLAGIGFAIPGPFDYRHGISKMQHKFKSLYDHHLPTQLNALLLADRDLPMRFLNDATCFAIGEAWQGQGRGFKKAVVVTLGTGFGSAFLDRGIPVVSGGRVPPEGCLWHLPFQDGLADDYFSTRWFIEAYRKETGQTIAGVRALVEKAGHDAVARQLFVRFGQNLAACLAPWLRKFDAGILIAGGNIAHALPLFEAGFRQSLRQAGLAVPIVASHLMETAALFGSGRLMDDAFWNEVAADLPAI